MKQQIDFFRMI